MLLFRSEEAVDRWCADAGQPRGQILTLPQLWKLSQLWYADRLSPAFAGRAAAQVSALFDQAGLSGPFWALG